MKVKAKFDFKQQWEDGRNRFNKLSLRERVVLSAGAAAVVFALGDFFALQPMQLQQKRTANDLVQARNTIRANDEALAASRRPGGVDDVQRRYRDELRKQVADLEGRIKQVQQQLVRPDEVARMLEGILTKDRQLTLVSLKKLPVQTLHTPAAAKAGAASGGDRAIFRHGFEVTLEGSYADMHAYLKHVEKLPWQLYWGDAVLEADDHSRLRLTLKVHTLSFSKAWLVV